MPRTPDRSAGLRLEDALSLEVIIDDEFTVPANSTLTVDDPELTLNGCIELDPESNMLVL